MDDAMMREREALRVALFAFMNATSDENGWGTYQRMEGSDLYGEIETARKLGLDALRPIGERNDTGEAVE